MRRREIDTILLRMFNYYQVEVFKPDVLEIYHELFERWSIEDIKKACSMHMDESKWFPKFAELKKYLPQPHVPQIESTANVQASHVLQMIRQNGYRYEPVWQDPITKLLMRTRWKWASLCETSTEDNEKWFVKEFVEAYLSSSDYHHDDFDLLEGGKQDEVLKIANNLFESVK